jgi:S-adenosylmethionine:tRNA-ribosyltransferase-isomerase (queuine synthetase)
LQSFADILRLYDYVLPKARIATAPATPRDSAKLLVYHRSTEKVEWSTVRSLPDFLPKGSVLVLNDTKVVDPAGPVVWRRDLNETSHILGRCCG